MSKLEKEGKRTGQPLLLKGTTLSVYRFVFREGKPVGPRDVQRGLRLSSASVASYHITKLVEAGLIREVENGYVVDRMMFENVIRIRRMLIPIQASFAAFFATIILVLLTALRPPVLYPAYYLSVIGLVAALIFSMAEIRRATSKKI